ncbi:MAG: haloacid dehalogenase-like hydrolase [Gemmatimonadota bacterium]|nr:haloacid dehalogenase-like hydrolase [Gemmatimonadota bacterium]
MALAFASVILDVDSTLCGLEGIDWLAERRGADVGKAVTVLTDRAMRGEIPLESVYGERLALVRPGVSEIRELTTAYIAALAPGAKWALGRLQDEGCRVVLVSGGLREAILPVASLVGIPSRDVHAVSVMLTGVDAYAGFEMDSPLATAGGKREVAARLGLPGRVLGVGDGATDLAMRPAVDAFAAYVGFVRREAVVRGADHVLTSFDQLLELVLV